MGAPQTGRHTVESVRAITRAATSCRLGGAQPAVEMSNITAAATTTLIGTPPASSTATMKRTTFFRLAGALTAVLAFAANAQVDSLTEIRNTAHAYVKSLIPASAGETTITVNQLDSRLHLAPCAPRDLSASLPPGASLQARTTVGVSCSGPVPWRIFVPVNIESKIDVLVLAHAVNRDAQLTAADVTVETRRTAGPGNAKKTKPTKHAGQTERRPLAAGTTLSIDMFA